MYFLGPPSSPPIIGIRLSIIIIIARTAVVQKSVTEKAKLYINKKREKRI